MESETSRKFSKAAGVFHDRYLPEKGAQLAGYAALMSVYQLEVPLPDRVAIISQKHKRYQKDHWLIFTPKHQPENTLHGHLVFALKYEGVNLSVLSALFKVTSQHALEEIIQGEPWSSYSRRIWFLYEWLTGKQLNIPDINDTKINFINVLDEKLQYAGPIRRSVRHRINNNLPGVQSFCPLIRRTALLDNYIHSHLNTIAKLELKSIHPDLLIRAAAFLLLKDSKASYAIEGETPPQNRAERWGKAIGQAGLHPLSHDELLRLQEIVIADFRYTHPGYRIDGGFVGDHDRATQQPIPVHISARFQDVPDLMDGLIETDNLLKEAEYNPVLAAAAIAFGFVFIHPFEDGNGRIHRYLIHHVLAENGFTPEGVAFPVSAVILDRLKEYRMVLEAYSSPRLKYVKWRANEKNNVEVLNETIDLYRYFDATIQAEFLFSCIKETIEEVIPKEIDYLQKYDEMKRFIENYIEMPDRLVNLLIIFLQQGEGKLSKRAKDNEFSALTQEEVNALETKFSSIFYR
ncbi:Fic family protein [Candidatus Berkiella aquae]|uniref:Fic family protein n=1 Tax=Candidatus Berkiella aquae TaxID=295108 RepID=A0A0Q9YLK2_9GAMM|nr:Fic family protein [Candidatus Berkiella aquae]MCS5711557.1 Fic family protein [Candidatus Berkiella aquae]